MSGCWWSGLGVFFLLAALSAGAQEGTSSQFEQEFQSASAHYHAGEFKAAAAQLEQLCSALPSNFAAHEMLGLTYAAEGQHRPAAEQLRLAAALNPRSSPARLNLATALLQVGDAVQAEAEFREASELAPDDYSANHDLAEFYLQSKRVQDALPLLEKASEINPGAYDNSYNLALAYYLTGHLGQARQLVASLLVQKNTGELHNLLGQIDEKEGKFVEAANEFGAAAHMDPSEENLFAWASELLLHRTYDPAIEVFQSASERYPKSPRLLIGLGMALYSRGRYAESIKYLLRAADINPRDPRCYLFLSKAYLSSPDQADEVIRRFKRYAELEPSNALAQYYYAISLWKGKRVEDSPVDLEAVKILLEKAIALDGTLAEAHLQLGILLSGQHQYEQAAPEYRRAIALDPKLPDPHYRLGQYYVHAGEKDRAQQEFALFQQLKAQHTAAVDKERAEVQQFVYAAQGGKADTP